MKKSCCKKTQVSVFCNWLQIGKVKILVRAGLELRFCSGVRVRVEIFVWAGLGFGYGQGYG